MGTGCVQKSLVVINIIFLLGGLAILGLGIWVQVEKGDYVALADSDTGLTGAILIIAVGSATVLISFLGFLGAIKKSGCLLWLFFSLLAIIIIVEIVAVIIGMVYQDKIEEEFHKDLNKTIAEYLTDVEGVTKAWDWAQKKFKCCGVDDYKSWRFSNTKFNTKGSHYLVPDSCCKVITDKCGDLKNVSIPDSGKINTKGCYNELREFIRDHLLTIGLGALGFLMIELVVAALTLILAVSLSSKI